MIDFQRQSIRDNSQLHVLNTIVARYYSRKDHIMAALGSLAFMDCATGSTALLHCFDVDEVDVATAARAGFHDLSS